MRIFVVLFSIFFFDFLLFIQLLSPLRLLRRKVCQFLDLLACWVVAVLFSHVLQNIIGWIFFLMLFVRFELHDSVSLSVWIFLKSKLKGKERKGRQHVKEKASCLVVPLVCFLLLFCPFFVFLFPFCLPVYLFVCLCVWLSICLSAFWIVLAYLFDFSAGLIFLPVSFWFLCCKYHSAYFFGISVLVWISFLVFSMHFSSFCFWLSKSFAFLLTILAHFRREFVFVFLPCLSLFAFDLAAASVALPAGMLFSCCGCWVGLFLLSPLSLVLSITAAIFRNSDSWSCFWWLSLSVSLNLSGNERKSKGKGQGRWRETQLCLVARLSFLLFIVQLFPFAYSFWLILSLFFIFRATISYSFWSFWSCASLWHLSLPISLWISY